MEELKEEESKKDEFKVSHSLINRREHFTWCSSDELTNLILSSSPTTVKENILISIVF